MSRQQWCSRSELRLRTIVMDTRHMRHPADPHPAWCTTFMTRPPVQLSMAATMNVVSLSPCPPMCCARGIKPSLCRPGSSRHTPVVVERPGAWLRLRHIFRVSHGRSSTAPAHSKHHHITISSYRHIVISPVARRRSGGWEHCKQSLTGDPARQ